MSTTEPRYCIEYLEYGVWYLLFRTITADDANKYLAYLTDTYGRAFRARRVE
jgi:hypothetical protein